MVQDNQCMALPFHAADMIIKKIISKFPRKHRDDLYPECYLELNKLWENYDLSVGVMFSTYSYKRLYYHCLKYIATSRFYVLSLDDYVFGHDDEMTERNCDDLSEDESLEDNLDMADVLSTFMKTLDSDEQIIVKARFLDEMTLEEILKTHGNELKIKTVKTIRQKLKKIFYLEDEI